MGSSRLLQEGDRGQGGMQAITVSVRFCQKTYPETSFVISKRFWTRPGPSSPFPPHTRPHVYHKPEVLLVRNLPESKHLWKTEPNTVAKPFGSVFRQLKLLDAAAAHGSRVSAPRLCRRWSQTLRKSCGASDLQGVRLRRIQLGSNGLQISKRLLVLCHRASEFRARIPRPRTFTRAVRASVMILQRTSRLLVCGHSQATQHRTNQLSRIAIAARTLSCSFPLMFYRSTNSSLVAMSTENVVDIARL